MTTKNSKPFDYYQEKLQRAVKKNQLKYSSQREYILQALFECDRHLTPEEILQKVRNRHHINIGLATVYRAMSFLEKEHLVNSLSFGAEGKKYELNRGAHHDHMICIKCGKIIEFFDERLEALQKEIAKQHGFELLDHELHLLGICSECSKKSS